MQARKRNKNLLSSSGVESFIDFFLVAQLLNTTRDREALFRWVIVGEVLPYFRFEWGRVGEILPSKLIMLNRQCCFLVYLSSILRRTRHDAKTVIRKLSRVRASFCLQTFFRVHSKDDGKWKFKSIPYIYILSRRIMHIRRWWMRDGGLGSYSRSSRCYITSLNPFLESEPYLNWNWIHLIDWIQTRYWKISDWSHKSNKNYGKAF